MDPVVLATLLVVVFFSNVYGSSVGGGGLLVIPAMFLAGIPTSIVVGTNRFYRIFASGAATLKFMKEIKVDLKNIILYASLSVIGSVAGALIVISLDESFLKLVISIALLFLAVFFLLKKDLGLKEQKQETIKQNIVASSAVMVLLGIYRSIIGSATGTFLRMYFLVKEKLTFLQAATYSGLIATISNISASIVFINAGIIDYWLAAYLIIAGVTGSYLGARLAIKKGNAFVRKLFLIVVVLSSLKLIGGVLFGI
jgi:uncharacterized membrane protein YfcA